MKRRRLFLAAGLVGMAAVAILLWPRAPKEPVYQDRPLSEWLSLDTMPSLSDDPTNAARKEENLRKALYATRAEALPYLLHQFTISESKVGLTIRRVKAEITKKNLGPDPVESALLIGTHGLKLMGSNATPALPILAGYIDDPLRAYAAVSAMQCCGEAAIPFLVKAASSTNSNAASGAATAFGGLAKQNESVIPHLVQLTAHTGEWVRIWSLHALIGIERRPDLTVPALIRALSDTNFTAQNQAIRALGELKSAAQPAVPALQRLLTNGNSRASRWASNALFRIDPAALPAPRPPP